MGLFREAVLTRSRNDVRRHADLSLKTGHRTGGATPMPFGPHYAKSDFLWHDAPKRSKLRQSRVRSSA